METYRDTKVDSRPTGCIVGVKSIGGARSGNVDDRGDLVLFQHLTQLALVLDGDEDFLDRDAGLGVDILFDLGGCCISSDTYQYTNDTLTWPDRL